MAVGISEAPVHLRFCLERKEINQTQSWNPIFWQWDRIKLVVHSHYFLIMLLDPPWEEGVSRGEFQLLLHSCFPALSSDRCTSAQGGRSCSGTWVNYKSFAEPKKNYNVGQSCALCSNLSRFLPWMKLELGMMKKRWYSDESFSAMCLTTCRYEDDRDGSNWNWSSPQFSRKCSPIPTWRSRCLPASPNATLFPIFCCSAVKFPKKTTSAANLARVVLNASSCSFWSFLSAKTAIKSLFDIFSSSWSRGRVVEKQICWACFFGKFKLNLAAHTKWPEWILYLTWTNLGLVNVFSSSPSSTTSPSNTTGKSSSTDTEKKNEMMAPNQIT